MAAKKTKKVTTEENTTIDSITPIEEVAPIEAAISEADTKVESVEGSELAESTEKKAKKAASKKESESKDKHSKRFTALAATVDTIKSYPIDEAVALVKNTATTKFTGSVEVHLNVSVKPLRGFVNLPHGTGKKKTSLVFGSVKEQDGVIIGTDKTIDEITSGSLVAGRDFDTVIATPAFMPKLAKVAKILGPKGLMPNPKSGTVTENPEKTLHSFAQGQVEYKTEANGSIIHMIIGKTNAEEKAIKENFSALVNTIGQGKITKATLNATMGPGIKVRL